MGYALIFGRLPFISQSLEQLFREKERPINASFWGHDGVTKNSPGISYASLPGASPRHSVAGALSRSKLKPARRSFRNLGGKIHVGKIYQRADCYLLQKFRMESDREHKVYRWPDLNDLLQTLMHPKSSMRLSAKQIKEHPWVTKNGTRPFQEIKYK